MRSFAFGLCFVCIIGFCVGTATTTQAAETWQSRLFPVHENDAAGGHVTVVHESEFGGGSHIIVVAHGLLPNTEYEVQVGQLIPVYVVQVSTNHAGILTLQDFFDGNATGYAAIREPDGSGGLIPRLSAP